MSFFNLTNEFLYKTSPHSPQSVGLLYFTSWPTVINETKRAQMTNYTSIYMYFDATSSKKSITRPYEAKFSLIVSEFDLF